MKKISHNQFFRPHRAVGLNQPRTRRYPQFRPSFQNPAELKKEEDIALNNLTSTMPWSRNGKRHLLHWMMERVRMKLLWLKIGPMRMRIVMGRQRSIKILSYLEWKLNPIIQGFYMIPIVILPQKMDHKLTHIWTIGLASFLNPRRIQLFGVKLIPSSALYLGPHLSFATCLELNLIPILTPYMRLNPILISIAWPSKLKMEIKYQYCKLASSKRRC